MTEEDYKDVITSYQQKAFELFNQNIVYETQINTLKKNIIELQSEIQVFDALGANVYSGYVNQFSLPTAGMYFVQIINPQGQIVDIKKIILQ